MRNGNIRRGHSTRSYNNNSLQIGDWITQNLWYIIGIIIVIFIGIKVFGGNSNAPADQGSFLSVSAHDSKSVIYISDADAKKTQITSSGSLYINKGSLMVEAGNANAKLGASTFDISANSEIQYKEKKSIQVRHKILLSFQRELSGQIPVPKIFLLNLIIFPQKFLLVPLLCLNNRILSLALYMPFVEIYKL